MVLICISLISDVEHLFFFFSFYSVTIVCIFSPSLHPTPANMSIDHLYVLFGEVSIQNFNFPRAYIYIDIKVFSIHSIVYLRV